MLCKLKRILFCVVVLASQQFFMEAKKCKNCHLKKAREKRLLAVRGQMLTKLGLFSPPESRVPDNVTHENAMEIFNAVVEQRYAEAMEELRLQKDDNDYFAKRIVQLPLEDDIAAAGYLNTSYKSPDGKEISLLRFNASQLVDEQLNVVRAELRLYHSGNGKSLCKLKIRICDKPNSEHRPLIREADRAECSSFLSEKTVAENFFGWITLDATKIVQSWSVESVLDTGITVMGTCGDVVEGDVRNTQFAEKPKTSLQGEALLNDQSHLPSVIVWTHSQSTASRKRQKRSLDSKFCKKRKKSKKCCLRRLYINFHKDLKWNWIHAPRGFYANYCSGKCPFLWGSENHHSTIMGLYNSLNKDANGDPCCVAKSYAPLVILYFDNNRRPKMEEMSHMSVTECMCL